MKNIYLDIYNIFVKVYNSNYKFKTLLQPSSILLKFCLHYLGYYNSFNFLLDQLKFNISSQILKNPKLTFEVYEYCLFIIKQIRN